MISNGKVRYFAKPIENKTKTELWVRLNELEVQLRQLQALSDQRYGQVKWTLDGIQQQLSAATLWAKEAAKNTYNNSQPYRMWLIMSVTFNILLIGSLLAIAKGI